MVDLRKFRWLYRTSMCVELANEVEQLRDEVDRLRDEVDRLQSFLSPEVSKIQSTTHTTQET